MNALLISLLVFAIVFGGAVLGAVLRPLLSEKHLQPDSKDVVKMALFGQTNLVVMASLFLCACHLPARFFWFWSWITPSRG